MGPTFIMDPLNISQMNRLTLGVELSILLTSSKRLAIPTADRYAHRSGDILLSCTEADWLNFWPGVAGNGDVRLGQGERIDKHFV